MTITVTDILAGPFTGTGAPQVQAFGFKAFTAGEVEVFYQTDLAETVVDPEDYSVALNEDVDGSRLEGGTVTITATLGAVYYIRAKPSDTQDQVWTNQGGRLSNLNEALDRLVLVQRRQAYEITLLPAKTALLVGASTVALVIATGVQAAADAVVVIEAARDAATSDITGVQAAATAAVNAAGDAKITAIGAAGDVELLAIANAGDAELLDINTAGAARLADILALSSNGLYATAYTTVLPKGVVSGTVGGTAVTGATPGTYPLTAVGGSISGVAANLVVASATSASIVVTNRGLGAGVVAPTWANPAGATLPVGTTLTAVVGDLIPVTEEYVALSADGNTLQAYQNTGTGVPVILAGVALRTKAWIDAALTSIPAASLQIVRNGKNLFNRLTAVIGSYMPHNSGVPVVNATWDYSALIPVTAGLSYTGRGTINGMRFITPYAADGVTVIAGGISADPGTITFTAPVGAYFVRVSLWHYDLATFQFEQAAAATIFEEYKYRLIGVNGETVEANVGALAVTNAKIAAGAVSGDKTNFLVQGKNLFDKATATLGFFLGHDGSAPVASAGFFYSAFIPVLPSTTYNCQSVSNCRFVTYYGAAGEFIAGGGQNVTSFTTPANVYYVRFTGYLATINTYQFELGAAQTAYENYGFYNNGRLLGFASSVASPWSGKRVASLGDSITAGNQWQPYLASKHGVVLDNYGIGGTRLSGGAADAMWQDARINAIPTAGSVPDAIILLPGTNDWAQNVALGVETSVNTNEFYGALNVALGKLVTRFPLKRIFVGTTTYGKYAGVGWTDNEINTQGLSTRHYAEALRVGARRWGLPVIDFNAECGVNANNLTNYTPGGGDTLHPNAAYGVRMGEVAVGRFNDIAPVA